MPKMSSRPETALTAEYDTIPSIPGFSRRGDRLCGDHRPGLGLSFPGPHRFFAKILRGPFALPKSGSKFCGKVLVLLGPNRAGSWVPARFTCLGEQARRGIDFRPNFAFG